MLFTERIKQLRIATGKRQRDLAAALGVDVPAYCRYEHGDRRPTRQQVIRLARQLGTDADELIALWLADDALDRIAGDPCAARAAALLSQALSDEKTGEKPDEEQPQPTTAPTATRDLVAKLGPNRLMPYYVQGDALATMQRIEDEAIDCIITTPPYWRRRALATEGVTGNTPQAYIDNLLLVAREAWRGLKPQGSMWLNMGDATVDGAVQGLPWRVAIALMDQGWQLVNDVVWNKQSTTPQGSQDHLRKVHEYMFHLVKQPDFYYNDDALRATMARLARTEGLTPTGGKRPATTGERYLKKIAETDALTPQEKAAARRALNATLRRLNMGDITDMRLFLREHKDEKLDPVSPRARAINDKGYYLQTHSAQGIIPGDVWEVPVVRSRIAHYTVAPDTLYRLPIVATCPRGGIVLDPYCGTGTACRVAYEHNCRSIGIDINPAFLKMARDSVEAKPLSLF